MRNFLRKILCWIYPQLNWLHSKEYDFTKLRSWQSNVTKGEHVQIEPVHRISDVKIGRYTYISYDALISQTDIGNFCSIGPNVWCGWGIHPVDGISTASMFYSTNKLNGVTLSNENKVQERKRITIGNDVFVGANVTILDGVTIGNGAVIGAGAIVSKDIPPYAIAVGNPIRILRFRMTDEQIAAMQRIQWWNFDGEQLKDVERLLFDIDAFITKYDTK